MEFKEVEHLKEKADKLLKALDNETDWPTIVGKTLDLLLMQDKYLGHCIDTIGKDLASLRESHIMLGDQVSRLQEEYMKANSVSELVVGD